MGCHSSKPVWMSLWDNVPLPTGNGARLGAESVV